MDFLSSCWPDILYGVHVAAEQVAGLEHATVSLPFTSLSVIDLTNALLAGVFLRQTINFPVHWARLLCLTFVLCVGGSTLGAVLLGNRPRWFYKEEVFSGIVAGYWLMMHCPGDFAFKLYSHKHLQTLWKVLKGLAFAHSIGTFGVERVLEAQAAGHKWAAEANFWTFVTAGVLSGCGGGLLAEYLNLLLQEPAQYKRTRSGPSAAVLMAVYASVL